MTFLKWVGGKTQLLPELSELFPDMNKINGYIEPFCVCKDSFVLLNQQDRIRIQNIESRKDKQIDIFGKSNYMDSVMSFDKECSKEHDDRDNLIKLSHIDDFFVKDGNGTNIYNIRTRNGRTLNATEDHLFLFKNRNVLEWKKLKEIKFGDMVVVYPSIIPLSGKIDKEEFILDEKNIIDNIDENTNVRKVLAELKNAGLLPLTNKNPKLHIIARLYGFLVTDGTMSKYTRNGEREGEIGYHIRFIVGREPIEILNDIKLLGVNIGSYSSERDNDKYGKTSCTEINSNAFFILFKALGAPIGKKTNQSYNVPKWIYKCSMRIKQEFLGGLMGGDGTTVNFKYKKCYNMIIPDITGPGITQSKIVELENSLKIYLSEICSILDEFGIEYRIQYVKKYIRDDDKKEVVQYRIDFLDNHKNILRFLRYIGYRYDSQKIEMSYPIYEYLLSKEKRIGIDSLISRGNSFPIFDKWKQFYTLDNIVFDEVITIKKIEYHDKLYDISVENTHNYIVNEFVTHNCGGGSVFFYLKSNFNDILSKKKIYLSDINQELINCYRVVRDDVYGLMDILKELQDRHCEDHYYKIRDIYPPGTGMSNVEKAAMFIYLNKTCFNGLWRVNKEGKFNAHIGCKDKIAIFDSKQLIYDSLLLKNVHINVMSFENILKIDGVNNYFIYLDPPYYQMDGGGNFTKYTKDGFHLTKKSMLLNVFKELDRLNCKVVLSNAYTHIIESEYKDFHIKILKAKRIINSDGKNRGYVNEAIVLNYDTKTKQKTIDDLFIED